MIEFHYAPGACSFVPHVALELIRTASGQEFTAHRVRLDKGEHRSPEFLTLNPEGQVPVLVVDGRPLTQLVAICDWLDRSHPQARLFPADPWTRAQAMSALAWMNNTAHPTFSHVFMPAVYGKGEALHEELKRHNAARFRRQLDRIEAALAQRSTPWWFGEHVTVPDAYVVTLLRWGGIIGIDPDALPACKAFAERLAAEPAVAAVIERERLPLHMYRKPA